MKKLAAYIFLGLISLSIFSCRMDDRDPYHIMVRKVRFSKDSFFKGSNESPMDLKGKRELIALDYFEPDSNYRVEGHLELLDTPKKYRMTVTNAHPEEYYNLGKVFFTVNGHEGKLSVYQNAKAKNDSAGSHELFCPFTDETNGKGTYKAGRFLDLHRLGKSNTVTIDFNFAYNPYCAYNHEYSCPIPPEQNHLNFPVNAGEKAYKTGRFSFFK